MAMDVIEALRPIVDVLDRHKVVYRVGGSLASSAYGIPRSTLDVDLVADIAAVHIDVLRQELASTYYLDEEMISMAIASRTSFNLIHLSTMMKIDIFIPQVSEYDQVAFSRGRKEALDPPSGSLRCFLVTPEDLILRKLLWYVSGGMVSEQQVKDVVGVLKVQAGALDWGYLAHWAQRLELRGLLDRMCADAGVQPKGN